MAWDSTGRYYYRSVATPSGPRRVYVGGGLLGKVAAQLDAQERAQRAAQNAQRRQQRAAGRAIDADLDRTHARLRTLVTAALLANGWYQHKREWRRMDMKRLVQRYAEEAIMPPKDKTPRAAGGAKLATEAGAVNGRAVSGVMVAEQMVSSYCKGQPEAQAIIRQELRVLCRDLGLDAAPPIERELITHVAECWVWLKLAQLTLNRVGSTEHTFKEGQYREGRVSEAQRRYLRALHLLAKLRHMGPAVQVNVANQQVVMNGREEG